MKKIISKLLFYTINSCFLQHIVSDTECILLNQDMSWNRLLLPQEEFKASYLVPG